MQKTAISRRRFLESSGRAAVAASCCMFCRGSMAAESGAGSKFKTSYYSACGIYCGACSILMKSEKMDKLEKVECLGCFGDKLHSSCAKCEVRKCAMERKTKACSLCADYPCEKTKKRFAVNTACSIEAEKNLGRIKEKGLEKWLADEKAKWTCPKCGLRVSSGDKKCPKCGAALKNIG